MARMNVDGSNQPGRPARAVGFSPMPAWERIGVSAVAGAVALLALGCIVPYPILDWIITPAAWAISATFPEQSRPHPILVGVIAEFMTGGGIGVAIACIAPRLGRRRTADSQEDEQRGFAVLPPDQDQRPK